MLSELALPPRLGLKAVSIAPVVASKAKIRLRTRSSPLLAYVPAGLTEVNVPAAMILLPTWVIAITAPFMTCGVLSAGFAETTRSPWSAFTAPAGETPCPSSKSAEAVTVPRARRSRDVCIRVPPSSRLGLVAAGVRRRADVSSRT